MMQSRESAERKINLVLLTLVTEKWSEPCFVHLNGVWISYANSFVTLQILMYLNKSNIQIPKYVSSFCYEAPETSLFVQDWNIF